MDSKAVLDIFKEITTIPRESGHEEPMTMWLQSWARSHSLACDTDRTGNVLITREAAAGKEDVPAIVLQAHQDMVCEKNKSSFHDFLHDPIDYVIRDGWMIAEDTTLGADDGIGIAACLALLADDKPTGKVECLFTISEETGMDGAFALEEGFFTGKTLINLDSEDEGQLFIGCAGGIHTDIDFKVSHEPLKEGYGILSLSVKGGLGGHSGDDINKGRANTVQELSRFLYSELNQGMQLVSINGGGKSNAIAREAEAVVAVPDVDGTRKRFSEFGKDLDIEYRVTDPGIHVACNPAQAEEAIDGKMAYEIIRSLFSCPHGVYAMSQDIEGLVETSTNLASVKTLNDDTVHVCTSQRSSLTSHRDMMAARVEANFAAGGVIISHNNPYPGWAPNIDSHILKVCVDSYRRLFSQEPEVKAIHAGLECGLFLEKFKDLDMISFGPTLRGVHAPGEKLELASLDKFVELLDDVVCNFR